MLAGDELVMEGAGNWAKSIVDKVPTYCKKYLRGELTIQGIAQGIGTW